MGIVSRRISPQYRTHHVVNADNTSGGQGIRHVAKCPVCKCKFNSEYSCKCDSTLSDADAAVDYLQRSYAGQFSSHAGNKNRRKVQ